MLTLIMLALSISAAQAQAPHPDETLFDARMREFRQGLKKDKTAGARLTRILAFRKFLEDAPTGTEDLVFTVESFRAYLEPITKDFKTEQCDEVRDQILIAANADDPTPQADLPGEARETLAILTELCGK